MGALGVVGVGWGVPVVGFFTGFSFSFISPLGKTAAWAVAVGPFSQTRGLSDFRFIAGSLTFPQNGA